MKPMSTAIVHFGTGRIGSAPLQTFLRRNTQLLAQHGITYPDFLGKSNHSLLADPFIRLESEGDLRTPVGDHHNPAFVERMHHELSVRVTENSTWIFSGDQLWRKLVSESEVKALASFFAAHFSDVSLIAYVRRQDHRIPARFTHQLLGGRDVSWDRHYFAAASQGVDYWNIQQLWSEAFGTTVEIRPFVERFHGDVTASIGDFLEWAQLPTDQPWEFPANPVVASMSASSLAITAALLPHIPPRDKASDLLRARWSLAAAVNRLVPGEALALPEDACADILNRHELGNRTLAQQGNSPLWEEWLDQPSATDGPAELPPVTADDLARVVFYLPRDPGAEHFLPDKSLTPPSSHVTSDSSSSVLSRLARRAGLAG